MANCARVRAGASISGQSESLPMTTPTSGLPLILMASLAGASLGRAGGAQIGGAGGPSGARGCPPVGRVSPPGHRNGAQGASCRRRAGQYYAAFGPAPAAFRCGPTLTVAVSSVLPLAEVTRSAAGPLAERIDVVAECPVRQDGDMAYLPPGPRRLAIQVHLDGGIGGHSLPVPPLAFRVPAGQPPAPP